MISLKTCIFICILVKIYLYIHNCKSEVSKTYTIVNALYIPEFYYLLYITLILYKLRMTQTIFLRKYICYMIYD